MQDLKQIGPKERFPSGHSWRFDLSAFDFIERASLLTTGDHDIFLAG